MAHPCEPSAGGQRSPFSSAPMNADAMLSRFELLALAPTKLPNFRTRRYLGDDLCLPIASLTSEDGNCIRALYGTLSELYNLFGDRGQILPAAGFQSFLARHARGTLLEVATQLGIASYRATPTALMGKVIHDIRGGGLTALLCLLQIAQLQGQSAVRSETLFFMARDHLKIMRNALLGLDDAKRRLDFLPKIHTTGMLAEKWSGAVLEQQGRPIRVQMYSAKSAPISECCIEFGALDRVLYNLLNNAARHTATDDIELDFLPVPDEQGPNGRLVVVNSLKPSDLTYLRDRRLDTIFLEGESTTDSGFGLAIAADFVYRAFGLSDPWTAVQKNYLGATLLGEKLAVWFHWPLAMDPQS